MAISSATRIGGLYSATELPMTTSFEYDVRRASAATIRLGEGIKPYAFWWCSLTQMPSKPIWSAYSSSSRYSL